MDFDSFKNLWLGRRIDYDHVFQFQCVDLILQGLHDMHGIGGGVSGNAIDYWVKTGINGFNEVLLSKFTKIPSPEADKGDIVILNGLPGNPFGHIGWATGNVNATDVEILEQNGQTGNGDGVGGNAIRVRWIPKNRIAGLLRPIVVASSPAPQPAVSGNIVHLPAHVATWAAYRVGSALRKGTSDQVGELLPARFGGLSYPIINWVGDHAVTVHTEAYGNVTLWVKDTDAQFSSAPEAPAPAPAVVHPYTVEAIAPKQVKLNKDTHLWGLNYDNFTAIDNNPEGAVNAGDIKTVVAILYHNIGYSYYLENAGVASGYNVVDCDDYTPPPPVPVKTAPPAGPLTAPSSETYEVVAEIGGYQSSNMAVNHLSEKARIPAGTYFVFNRRFTPDTNELIALNVTKTPGTPGAWVNPLDNTLTPSSAPEAPAEEPATVATPELPDFSYTYHAFEKPELYVAMNKLTVADLTGQHKTATMPKFSQTWITGTFTVNNVDYARPKSAVDKDWWYGIEWTDPATNTPNLELESEIFNAKTTITERQVTKTLTKADYFWLAVAHVKKLVLGFTGLFGKIRSGKITK